jgi:NTE family protein
MAGIVGPIDWPTDLCGGCGIVMLLANRSENGGARMRRSALVLGAGGHSGTAWTAGMLAGFHDAGIRRINADMMLGTSGGAIVAAVLAAGGPLDMHYRDGMRRAAERAAAGTQISARPGKSVEEVITLLMSAIAGLTDPYEIRRRVGKLALDEPTVPMSEYLEHIAAYLPYQTWPERRFGAAAVDAATGEPHVLDAPSGVDVVSAVAAACAIPLIDPCVAVGGMPCMDAGIRSNENLDLVADADSVLVMSPRGLMCPQAFGGRSLAEDVALARDRGAGVEVLEPEGEMLDLIAEHMLDSGAFEEISEASRGHGRRVAGTVAFLAEHADHADAS